MSTFDKRIIDLTVEELLGILDNRYSKENKNNRPIPKDMFLRIKSCAELTGYSQDYLRQLVHKRKIPFTKLNNGALRFIFDDIIEWMKAAKRLPMEEEAQNYIENANTKNKSH